MAMIDLKKTKSEMKEEKKDSAISGPVDEYPWGLILTFNKDVLDKFGIDILKVDIGQKATLRCEASITAAHQSASKTNTDRSVTLQIQKMECSLGETPSPSRMKGYLSMRDSGPGGKAD